MKFPKKIKNRINIQSRNPLLSIFLKKTKNMFTAALFTIAKIWMQPKCPSTDEWIKRLELCIPWNITHP